MRSISGFFGAAALGAVAVGRHRHQATRGALAVRHDLDAGVEQVGAERHDLLLRDLHLFEAGSDLVERQIAALTTFGGERAQLLDIEESRLGSLLEQSDTLLLLRQPLAP